MINIRSNLLVLIIFISGNLLSAKQPDWVKNIPHSDHFSYYSGTGSSKILEEAKKKAVSDAIFEIIQSGNITVIGEQEVKSRDIEENGELDYRTEIIEEVIIKGESKDIYGLKSVGDYWEKKESKYNYWVLLRVPRNKSYSNMPIYKINSFAPIWRSTLVPG